MACVGSQAITESLFRHWAHVAQLAEGPVRKRHATTRAALDEAMSFLISADWVTGEARDLNVRVSDAEVRRRFDRIRRQQFPKRTEFNAFLRSSGQTVADLLFRVRGNVLAMRIQRRVIGRRQGAAAAEALTRFVREFKSKWVAQTYCLPAYAVSDCGHVQAML